MNAEKSRRAMFAACRALGLDDDARRAMMQGVTGKASSRDFNALDWAKVLNHLNRQTGRQNPNNGIPQGCRPGCEGLLKKIGALLADQQLPWRYLTAAPKGRPSMCQRLAGVDILQFATPKGLHAIVAALEYRRKKAGVPS